MAEYIEKEELINKVESAFYWGYLGDAKWANGLIDTIREMPAADVVPVKHGKWIKKHRYRGGYRKYTGVDSMGVQHTIVVDERYETDDLYCPFCGKWNDSQWINHCPNCGARMDL